MNQTLYILQGPPGSGKSWIARALKAFHAFHHPFVKTVVCSTDDFHEIDGVYIFQPEKLGYFHKCNLEKAQRAMAEGHIVVIDNTNIKRKDVKPYVKHAVGLNIPVVFVRVTGNFKSIHGVPDDVIQRMKAQMQDLSIESVMGEG